MSRVARLCHVVPSDHNCTVSRSNSELTDICCHVLPRQKGVPGRSLFYCPRVVTLPASPFILPSSCPPSPSGESFSALLGGRGLRGVQLNESMSKEDGYFGVCQPPPTTPPVPWRFSRVPLHCLTLAGQSNADADLELAVAFRMTSIVRKGI